MNVYKAGTLVKRQHVPVSESPGSCGPSRASSPSRLVPRDADTQRTEWVVSQGKASECGPGWLCRRHVPRRSGSPGCRLSPLPSRSVKLERRHWPQKDVLDATVFVSRISFVPQQHFGRNRKHQLHYSIPITFRPDFHSQKVLF